jgi:hypothetical protein
MHACYTQLRSELRSCCKYKPRVEYTLDYPCLNYSVCELSVHDYFFNLPSIWFIKLRTINVYKNIWFIKSITSLCVTSAGVRADTQGVASVWEEHVSQAVCLTKGVVSVWNIKFGLSVFFNYPCVPQLAWIIESILYFNCCNIKCKHTVVVGILLLISQSLGFETLKRSPFRNIIAYRWYRHCGGWKRM